MLDSGAFLDRTAPSNKYDNCQSLCMNIYGEFGGASVATDRHLQDKIYGTWNV